MKFLRLNILSLSLAFSTNLQAQTKIQIIGGEEVIQSDPIAQSTVAITIKGYFGDGICTGSIIDHDIILTAAHCIKNKMTISFDVEQGKNTVPVNRAIKHSEYKDYASGFGSPTKDRNDVALLHFSGGIPAGYRIAKLLPVERSLKVGEEVSLAGYGIRDINDPNGDTSGRLYKTNVTIADPNYSNTEVKFDSSHGHSDCFGDSGGPAFIVDNNDYYLFGVTNWGDEKCKEFSIYAKINPYREWIEKTKIALRSK